MSRQPGKLIIREYKGYDQFELKFFDENQNSEWRTVNNDQLIDTLTGGQSVCCYCREQLGEESCNTRLISVYGCIKHLKKLEIDRNDVLIRKYEKKREDKKEGTGKKKTAKKESRKRSKSQSDGSGSEQESGGESKRESDRQAGRESGRDTGKAGKKTSKTSKKKVEERVEHEPTGERVKPKKKSRRKDEHSQESIRLTKPGEDSGKRQPRLATRPRPAPSRGKAIFEGALSPTGRVLRSGTMLPDLHPITSTPATTPPLLEFTPQLPYRPNNSYYDLSNASQVSAERLQGLVNDLSLNQLNRSLRDLGSIHLTPERLDRRLPALSPEIARTNPQNLSRRRLFEDAERLQEELPSFSDSFIRREIVHDPENQIDLEFWTNVNVMRLEKRRPGYRSERTEANQAGSSMEVGSFDREDRPGRGYAATETDEVSGVERRRDEMGRDETGRELEGDENERNEIRRDEREQLEREEFGAATVSGDRPRKRKRQSESGRSKKKRSKKE